MSARGGRTPSGPWSRLKPVNIDPLDAVGLPSKGDNRYDGCVLLFTPLHVVCLLPNIASTDFSISEHKSDTMRRL